MTNHVILEQKRGLKLNQQFRDLSLMLPGSKNMDKTSLLEGCIKYIKEMEQRVKELEEGLVAETPTESVVFDNNSDSSSSTEDESSSTAFSYDGLFEIKTRVFGGDVLIQILCENGKGILVKIYDEIEKRTLGIVNSKSTSFGTSNLAIIVRATMRNEFNMVDVKILVNGLRSLFFP